MINLMENKVLAPLFQQRFEEGREEGREDARIKQQDLLLVLLSDKFGSVPPWAAQQVKTASVEDLDTWARRIIRATSLEETLR